jgi:hypothetical protein
MILGDRPYPSGEKMLIMERIARGDLGNLRGERRM